MLLRQETWREPSPATPHVKDWDIPDPFWHWLCAEILSAHPISLCKVHSALLVGKYYLCNWWLWIASDVFKFTNYRMFILKEYNMEALTVVQKVHFKSYEWFIRNRSYNVIIMLSPAFWLSSKGIWKPASSWLLQLLVRCVSLWHLRIQSREDTGVPFCCLRDCSLLLTQGEWNCRTSAKSPVTVTS